MQFSHLHNHSQFSLLDGASKISSMFKKAKADNMPAVAITDHGNMFGVFQFVAEAGKQGVKPIVGCEFYLVNDRHKQVFTKELKDKRYHQLFLAKNPEGYQNLVKLCSLGFMEGMYSKYPRIDKELVLKYHKGLIATTCCLGASVPQAILRDGEEAAEKEFKWWLDLFGEDYYIEVQNHFIPEQQTVNEVLLRFAKKYNVKVIASNDSHYLDQKDANAHDILLCINTGEKQATPTYKDIEGDFDMKGKRFAFYNDQFYFKTTEEMTKLWSHVPEAIDNTNEIVGKVETLKLTKDVMLPNFQIPSTFLSQDDYLEHITMEGAKKRYIDIDQVVEERLRFELHTIRTMGFAGYFLIVADFISAGRDLGVYVGPGRGSAAGSVVAYCLGITNIDPIKYNLLFERFLNPDRKSLPDIDTDFDDEGRQKVIDYVVDKYGKNQVAHIATYGTMAAKMSIKDVSRVLDLPLQESNALAKLVPEKPKITLDRIFNAALTGDKSLADKEGLNPEELEQVKELRRIKEAGGLQATVIENALILEGSVRGTGIHAAGIIIAPSDLTDILPVATSKDVSLLITQYDGSVIENAGVIKMDFLGLKTLSILKEAVRLIKQNHNETIILDDLPLDDKTTYELYQRAETNGTFQFESPGMQKHLRDLKPDQFSDLIAMNALFRPGPMVYIPNYIARKHGREKIEYDLPEMEEYLSDTYGITVYQEQVMLLSQKLANFTKGDADVLRKAMGKKDKATIDKMKGKFMEGGAANNHPVDKLDKIWTDWEAFAQYAFNKSHSTCYGLVAYQTGYLKANYPPEFMAAVLSNSLGNIEKITFFMDECKRMGLSLLVPDVNESSRSFAVNKKGQIRFGLGAIKGVGDAAVDAIVEERQKNGEYKDIFDFVSRINVRQVNKKSLESLALAGAFDCFTEVARSHYFAIDSQDNTNFIEKIVRYSSRMAELKAEATASLFGELGAGTGNDIAQPKIPTAEPWSVMEQLKNEKEVVGVYISGHPLDEYKTEIANFCNSNTGQLELRPNVAQTFAGIVTKVNVRTSANGNQFMIFTIEDYAGNYEFALFSKDYIQFERFIAQDRLLFINGSYQLKNRHMDQMVFKIQSIELLSEILSDRTKEIKLRLDLNRLTPALLDLLQETLERNKGDKKLTLEVYDEHEKIGMDFLSRKMQVSISKGLISELKELENVGFKLIS
ncbi:DNA polymerase III subunit alpha [Aquirufa antheringensis]|uniref:DNA polymerase III subunit alpha n=1 Tax=Aquirufa antheringensis TaxID=2516559 RepID=A0A4Q9BDU8_9BACT|nr:DNA polymerase III subunit alpha [Aquirufa antheringensis]MCZ2485920.1 DNA polymerase III subunit alpha [Aquirufa antheringensis]TBH73298.1 DNA polymerase III subunit alpha [Aquirufa antheringensis]